MCAQRMPYGLDYDDSTSSTTTETACNDSVFSSYSPIVWIEAGEGGVSEAVTSGATVTDCQSNTYTLSGSNISYSETGGPNDMPSFSFSGSGYLNADSFTSANVTTSLHVFAVATSYSYNMNGLLYMSDSSFTTLKIYKSEVNNAGFGYTDASYSPVHTSSSGDFDGTGAIYFSEIASSSLNHAAYNANGNSSVSLSSGVVPGSFTPANFNVLKIGNDGVPNYWTGGSSSISIILIFKDLAPAGVTAIQDELESIYDINNY